MLVYAMVYEVFAFGQYSPLYTENDDRPKRLTVANNFLSHQRGNSLSLDLSNESKSRGGRVSSPHCSCASTVITLLTFTTTLHYLQSWLTKKISPPLSLTMGLECAKVSYSAVLAFLIWLDGAAPYWRNDCHWKRERSGLV